MPNLTKVDDNGFLNFPLSKPFDYSKGGEQPNAQFIQCTAPTSRDMQYCAALKQAFFRALPTGEDTSEDTDADNLDIDGSDVMMMIAQSPIVELPAVLEVAAKLLTNGVAKVDGEVKLSDGLLKKMDLDDFEQLVGDYLVGFVLASSLSRMKAKLSEVSSI